MQCAFVPRRPPAVNGRGGCLCNRRLTCLQVRTVYGASVSISTPRDALATHHISKPWFPTKTAIVTTAATITILTIARPLGRLLVLCVNAGRGLLVQPVLPAWGHSLPGGRAKRHVHTTGHGQCHGAQRAAILLVRRPTDAHV
eukprot:365423-Chlamydomonas_euryale.AAC.9